VNAVQQANTNSQQNIYKKFIGFERIHEASPNTTGNWIIDVNFKIHVLAIMEIQRPEWSVKLDNRLHFFSNLTLFLLNDFLQCEVSQEHNCHATSEQAELTTTYAKLFKVNCNIQVLWTKFSMTISCSYNQIHSSSLTWNLLEQPVLFPPI
jgi:hypothetical protein